MALAAGGALVAEPAAAAPSDSRARFIVTVADGADSRDVAADHRGTGARIDFVYTAALNGFAGAMSDRDVAALQRDRRVVRIERDGVVTASETTQLNATWGLDRIDDLAGLDTSYVYDATGAGVDAYIVDTGIRFGHAEFGGRAVSGYDAIDGGTADDCDGHGTHVAGTLGGAVYGVAKAATLRAVRVLDCNGSGSWSGVIAGLDWVASHHTGGAAVANMSLGGGANSSVDDAVQRVIDDGVTVVVAAGNGDRLGRAQNACNYSPARVPDAVTIGATTQSDAKTSWSNYGDCVDLFAPGASITSAWYTSDTATNTISGTSMAAPHVAGVAALYLEGDETASALQVRDAISAASTKGIVTSSSTANNHLLHSRLGSTDGGTGNTAPTASFTSSCTDLTCVFTSTSSDSDGSIAGYDWRFGDGGTNTAANPSHTYVAGGTYTVTLTVTDSGGATGTTSRSVTVSGPASGGITLTATGYKVKGVQHADLTWSGATSTSVDVHRDGAKVTTTANDGAHTDNLNRKGGGSYTYKVCEAGTSTCSAEVTVTF